MAVDYLQYSCPRSSSGFWLRYTPSCVQTLNAIVALTLASRAGALKYKEEWTTTLDRVCTIVTEGISQRILGREIQVRFFEGNTAFCGECFRCNAMPYDYLGILHYLNLVCPSNATVPYHLPAVEELCKYYASIQRESGAWGSLDAKEYPDDVLVSAFVVLIMHYHDPIAFRRHIADGCNFILKQLDCLGGWRRPALTGIVSRPACTQTFAALVQHKCLEAVSVTGNQQVRSLLRVRVREIYAHVGLGQTVAGFISRTEPDGVSEVSGACHWLQAFLKSGIDPRDSVMGDLVSTILSRQLPNGGFAYTKEPGGVETADVSDITALVVQTLSLYLINSEQQTPN